MEKVEEKKKSELKKDDRKGKERVEEVVQMVAVFAECGGDMKISLMQDPGMDREGREGQMRGGGKGRRGRRGRGVL